MRFVQKLQSVLLRIGGYLVPLVQQIPTLGIYVGLMTLPLFAVLVILFTQFPLNIIGVISDLLMMSLMSIGVLIANLVTFTGILLTVYSFIYFQLHKRDGLVTTGPYRFIRHPQYTGFLLTTLGLTAFCYWWLSNTFGMGWLSKEATVALWFFQLLIYVSLALLEESHLARQYGKHYVAYKEQTSFFLPLGRFNRFDIPISIAILSLGMFSLILTQLIRPTFIFTFFF